MDPTPADEERLLGDLLPLASMRAHDLERAYRQDHGEFLTAALLGAWDAIRRYRPDMGASLATYARHRIDGEILDWHRRNLAQQGGGRGKPTRVTCVDFNDLGHDDRGDLTAASAIEFEHGRTSERGYSRVEDRDLLQHLRLRMDAREWDILVRCVCNEETQRSVGESYGISESRTCQILSVALAHARRAIVKMDDDRESLAESAWLARLQGLPPTA